MDPGGDRDSYASKLVINNNKITIPGWSTDPRSEAANKWKIANKLHEPGWE